MSTRKHDNSRMHDKSRGMLRESARERFMGERKEMEHELSHHKTEIVKLLNDEYTYLETTRYRGQYVVKFQHPDTHRMQKLTFHYEPNLKQLENMWNEHDSH